MKNRTLDRVAGWLSRLDVASVLIATVLLMAIVGSLFPQMPTTLADDSAGRAAWGDAVRARYGPLTGFLTALGVFSFGVSPLFLCAAGLLIAATLVCTLRGWRVSVGRVRDRTASCSDTWFERALARAELRGTSASQAGMESLRCELSRRRYRVRMEQMGDTLWLRADRNQWALLGRLAVHLAVPLLLVGFVLTAALGTRTERSIAPYESVPVNPRSGLVLRNDGFQILTNADGSPRSFEARITPLQGTATGQTRVLRVNEPLSMEGYAIYLASYWEVDSGYGIVLIIARDPGYLPVVAGGILMLLGLSAILWFPYTRLYAKLGPDEVLRVAAKGARNALALEPELEAILSAIVREPVVSDATGGRRRR